MEPTPLEFSMPVSVSALPAEGRSFSFSLDETTRRAVAKRFAIPAVKKFEADLTLVPMAGGARVTGKIEARLVRECVASLEPLEEALDETVDIVFDRALNSDIAPEDMDLETLAAEGNREPLTGDEIDIGELSIQQISLAMDPFPRLKNAVSLADKYGADRATSPFDVLAKLKADEKS